MPLTTVALGLLLLLCPLCARTQTDGTRARAIVDSLMLIQDGRVSGSALLARALHDSDPGIRMQALVVTANLQDTTMLDAISGLLLDLAPGVREAAAFAVGQTAGALSEGRRATLTRSLLQEGVTGACPRIWEEIGKFGPASTLSDYLSAARRLPDLAPVAMGLARYAIRGISSDAAAALLVTPGRTKASERWKVAYALQRIGRAPTVREFTRKILAMSKDPDPLVRMHVVTLLGKLTPLDPVSLRSVEERALHDTDWRVRVNAVRALQETTAYPGPGVRETLLAALRDRSMHVALAAITTIGGSRRPESAATPPWQADEELRRIAGSINARYPWQLQGEAMMALARRQGNSAARWLLQLRPVGRRLLAKWLAALGATADVRTLDTLLRQASNPDPLIVCAALEALQTLGATDTVAAREAAYAAAVRALTVRDVAVVATAAGVLGAPAYRRSGSVPPLLDVLRRLHAPQDIEAMQQVIGTLGQVGDTSAVPSLELALRTDEPAVSVAAAAALQQLTGRNYAPATGAARHIRPGDLEEVRRLPDSVLVRMTTTEGTVLLRLLTRAAPFTTARFVRLARDGFYDNLLFHRVVPNFVVQGGDPRGDGWGGPGYTIRSEVSLLRYQTGTLGMASAGKDTEGSQFFITHSPQPHLDGRYTILGEVVSGMEIVDRLQVGSAIQELVVEEP